MALQPLETAPSVTDAREPGFLFFHDLRTPGTCEWILENGAFLRWGTSTDDSPKMLWLHGDAGSGKSVLTAFIIRELIQSGNRCQYFFFPAGQPNKTSLRVLFRSLASQISAENPSFRDALSKVVGPNDELPDASPRLLWDLVFRKIFFQPEMASPMYWVLDGFDECDVPGEGIEYLAEVLKLASVPLKILITSRRTFEIQTVFNEVFLDLNFETLDLGKHLEDHPLFLKRELRWYHDPEADASLTKRLLGMAQGNFLWLRTMVERINGCSTDDEVESALEEPPHKVWHMYDGMAQQIMGQPASDRALTTDILLWVGCASRKITMAELREALKPEHPQADDLEERRFLDLCVGFVVVDSDEMLTLAHQSVRQYLVGGKQQPFGFDQASADEKLLLRCLDVLTESRLRRSIGRDAYVPLRAYATSSWASHLGSCKPDSQPVLSSLTRFLRSPSVLDWIHAVAGRSQLVHVLRAADSLSDFAGRVDSHFRGLWRGSPEIADLQTVEGWATDLARLARRFGARLLREPYCIYRLIPPLCPPASMIRKQFSRAEPGTGWDKIAARIGFPPGCAPAIVAARGAWVAVAVQRQAGFFGEIHLVDSRTWELVRLLEPDKGIGLMGMDRSGSLIVTCGHSRTQVWDVATGECVASARGAPDRRLPLSIWFSADSEAVSLAFSDGTVCRMGTAGLKAELEVVTRLPETDESPMCMSLSPDGQQAAVGYRGRPLSIWTSGAGEPWAVCDELTSVAEVAWHPSKGELFAITGQWAGEVLSKWTPGSGERPVSSALFVCIMAMSVDGRLLATSDLEGHIRLLSTDDLSLVHQLDCRDPRAVSDLALSPDCKRLYDVRDSVNVWELDLPDMPEPSASADEDD